MVSQLKDSLKKNADLQLYITGFILGFIISFIVSLANRHGIGVGFIRAVIAGAVIGGIFYLVKFAVMRIVPQAGERETSAEGDVVYVPSAEQVKPADSLSGTPGATAAEMPEAAAGAYKAAAAALRTASAGRPVDDEEMTRRQNLKRSNVDGLEDDVVSIKRSAPESVRTQGAPASATAQASTPREMPKSASAEVDKNSNLGHNSAEAKTERMAVSAVPSADTIDDIISPDVSKVLIDDFALDKAKENMRIEASRDDTAAAGIPEHGPAAAASGRKGVVIDKSPEVMARAVRTMMKRDAGK